MGGVGDTLAGVFELSVRYHYSNVRFLNFEPLSGQRTVSGGQLGWGHGLLNDNGDVQRFPLNG